LQSAALAPISSAMLRVFGPGLSGEIVDPSREKIPARAAWIDLEEPTETEEQLVERCVGVDVPTAAELAEIEPSSRLYERGDALYMTASVLYGVDEKAPSSGPIGFVLANGRLVTVRYICPKPVRAFADHAKREPELVADSLSALLGLLDAIVDRLADELEAVSSEIKKISSHIFHGRVEARRIPADRLTALLTRIGRTQMLLAKVRETEASTSRLLSFLGSSDRLRERKNGRARDRVATLAADTASLGDHSIFLSNHLYFLLDASVGLISIEQNAAMKLFSWVAFILLPPTLIAGIYGMNFEHMPELHWKLGYPLALAAMLASAVLPIWYFKRRGWL
jgi:magnesium transporter